MARRSPSPGSATRRFCSRRRGGKRILLDPWVGGNPACPESAKKIERARSDPDHARAQRPHRRRGVDRRVQRRARDRAATRCACGSRRRGIQNTAPMGHGRDADDRRHRDHDGATPSTPARSIEDGEIVYLGQASRLHHPIRGRPDDLLRGRHRHLRRHAADRRDVSADDRVSADRRSLHDGARAGRARRARLLGVRQVVPMHYGTFPFLTGTVGEFRALVEPKGVRCSSCGLVRRRADGPINQFASVL